MYSNVFHVFCFQFRKLMTELNGQFPGQLDIVSTYSKFD